MSKPFGVEIVCKRKLRITLKKLHIILFITLSVWMVACKTKQKTIQTTQGADTAKVITPDKELVEDKPADSLLRVIREKDLKFHSLSAKIDVDAETAKGHNSVGCTMRIINDSAIWVSISPMLGIEAFRILITKDSVKYINRINKTYFTGDYKLVNEMLQLDADYSMVQSILLGKTYLYYNEKNYLSSIDDNRYLLSSLPKRKLKKAINEEPENPFLIVHANWIDPLNFMVNKLFIKDFKHNRKLEVNYSNFATIDGQPVPHNISVEVKAEKPSQIKLVYSKVALNKVSVLPFSIPESYTREVKE